MTLEPLLQPGAPAPKRRGRPPKTTSKVVRQVRLLGLEHFAFVRATLMGLDLRKNFERYIAWAEPLSDLRIAQTRFEQLLGHIIDSGSAIDATLPEAQKITFDLRNLRQALREQRREQRRGQPRGHQQALPNSTQAPAPSSPALSSSLPTLEEWILDEGLDADFFSEAELLEQYQEAFGLVTGAANFEEDEETPDFSLSYPENRPSKTPQNALEIDPETQCLGDAVKRRIRALNHLESLLAQPPSPPHALSQWFAPSLCAKLETLGLLTLQNLVDHISVRGHRWYKGARGIGHGKSQQILTWLSLQSDPVFARARTRSVTVPAQRRAIEERSQLAKGLSPGMTLVLPPVFGIVPLERLMLPPALNGQGGVFRSTGPNTLDASTDLEAVNAWLAYHQERTSTERSYRKEAERFILFCSHVLRKPLSSVTAPDCMEYRAFLMDVPPHWMHPMPVTRQDPMWRPFRTQPGPASQKQAMVILQAMFETLRDANYVTANPFAAVIKGFDLPSSAIDLDRSLSQAEWQFVAAQARVSAHAPEGRRLSLMLDLLVSTGLRLDELANATRANMKCVSVDGESAKAWVLEVVGKRRKRRVVPVSDDLAFRLEDHAKDAQVAHFTMGELRGRALGAPPSPAPTSTPTHAAAVASPLIFSLNPAVTQWADVQGVATLQAQAHSSVPQGLSASGIYRTLKRFFYRCGKLAADANLDRQHLEAASTHWLRHSFGRQAAVSGVPIEVISQAMGHASLTTTSIYLTQERSRMIKELRKMHASVGAG